MNIEAVIFDMDGVIFDSERMSKQVWRESLAHLHMPEKDVDKLMIDITGINLALCRQIMNERLSGYPDFDYDACRAMHEELYMALVEQGKVPLKPYVRELLGWLRTSGIRIGLASSTRTEKVMAQLNRIGLADAFDRIIGGDLVTRGKPDPEIYNTCREALGVSPSNTFAVEDSYNGIRSAHAAGLHPLMVPDLLPPTEEMQRLADAILPSLGDVQTYLSEIRNQPFLHETGNSEDRRKNSSLV